MQRGHYSYDLLTPRPPNLIGGFIFFYLGYGRVTGRKIESFRKKYNIPVWEMCNIMAINTEGEYYRIVRGVQSVTTYQQIMIVMTYQKPLI